MLWVFDNFWNIKKVNISYENKNKMKKKKEWGFVMCLAGEGLKNKKKINACFINFA